MRERDAISLQVGAPPAARYTGFPAAALRGSKALLGEIRAQIPPEAQEIAEDVKRVTGGRFQEAALALASLHGVKWPEIMVANVVYDLFIAMGCSTVALPTTSGPVVARNMDWPMERALARASYVINYNDGDGKLAYSHCGFSASIGVVTGMSGKGFCLVVNAAEAPEPPNMAGWPVLLFMRKVLEDASGFEEALRMLSEQPLVVGAMVTLVGTTNEERVVVERGPTKHALRWGEPGKPLVTTNYYHPLVPPESGWACPRYDRAMELLGGYDDKDPDHSTDLVLRTMLGDPDVVQEITAQHIIMRPRDRSTRMFVPDHLA